MKATQEYYSGKLSRALQAVVDTPAGAWVLWLQAWVKPEAMCLEIGFYVAMAINPNAVSRSVTSFS